MLTESVIFDGEKKLIDHQSTTSSPGLNSLSDNDSGNSLDFAGTLLAIKQFPVISNNPNEM
jgi:hypothetical protein